jgi:RPA family protein
MNGVIRKREIARRLFAYEFNRSTHRIPSEEDKAPVYVLTPLGMRCNRVFIVGALLDKEEKMPDSGIWRIRVSDPTGAFFGYINRFQPDALEALMEIEPPELVAIVGKVRVIEREDRNFVFIRPEYISVVDSDVRDYWVYETALRTLERIRRMELGEDEDCKVAWQIYNPNLNEYRQIVKQALMSIKEEYEILEMAEESEEEIEELRDRKEVEELKEFEEEFEFEEEEWDLSDILNE